MMDMIAFNIDDGYAEAIVRGLRKGFLKEETYNALRSCQNLADFKLVLEETDYAAYIAAEQSPIEISVLKNRCKEKLAAEIEHMIAQSVYPLCEFLRRMLHGYMIDNVVNIIEGVKNSLKRLEHDYVDVVFSHRPDRDTPLEETLRAYDFVINQGWAIYWATSEWEPDLVARAIEMCERFNLHKPIAEQPQYHMFHRDNVEKF